MSGPAGPADPVVALATAGERALLTGMLDAYRAEVVAKARGLAEPLVRRRLGPSRTSVAGVVKHLRWVETSWFQHLVAGRPWEELPTPPWTDEDPDGEFLLADDETLELLLEEYAEECARSREVLALVSLDDVLQHPRIGPVTVRWVVLHMVEETARHAGHLDVYRELLDGTVGDWRP